MDGAIGPSEPLTAGGATSTRLPGVSLPTPPEPEPRAEPEPEPPDLPEVPAQPAPLAAASRAPSRGESLGDVQSAIRTLTTLHQANMAQHEAQLGRLQAVVADLAEELRTRLEEWQAAQEMHEEHLATLGEYLDRMEDLTAAHIRLIEEHASRIDPQEPQE